MSISNDINQTDNKVFDKILNLVVGYTFNKQGIGKDGKLPWHIPEDMTHFKTITTPSDQSGANNSVVIMGRKTWDSIPDKFKPLSNRINIVLSNDADYRKTQSEKYSGNGGDSNGDNKNTTCVKFTTWDDFFTKGYLELETINNSKLDYYIIGGETIYKKAIESNYNLIIHATEIYTQAAAPIECDTFFPKIENTVIHNVSAFYKSVKQFNGNDIWYRFITYSRINSNCNSTSAVSQSSQQLFYTPESDYLQLMRNILETGQSNDDRTGVGTLSIFGSMLKFDLRDTFPISTTKRIFFRAIFEELMLYLSGKTDNTILQEKGIHVWDGNTSRAFLDKRGLQHYAEGDMGQTYGFNMRHYGGIYNGCKIDYPLGEYGYDQLANVINLIKTDPYSRRIIIDLWDPANIDKAALPSCLCKYQFNVNVSKKELNLAIYLRSSDYFLANNWNTCTGALFVHLLCNLEGIDLTPGELTVFIADAHLYKSHIEQVKVNLERKPYPYPKLLVNCGNGKKEKKKDILDFKFEDLELLGYKAHPNIKAEMSI
jgi:dihydrofolate reductase/thymidylate synthase